jgi:Domain of unknown function (DUF5915)
VAVALDLELSEALIAEGKARELIRALNDLRKSLDFNRVRFGTGQHQVDLNEDQVKVALVLSA